MIGWGDVKLLPSLTAALAWAGLPTLVHGLVLWIVLLLATTAVWRVARLDTTDTTDSTDTCPTARRWCSAPWVRCWSWPEIRFRPVAGQGWRRAAVAVTVTVDARVAVAAAGVAGHRGCRSHDKRRAQVDAREPVSG